MTPAQAVSSSKSDKQQTSKQTRVLLLPRFSGNPYQKLLIDAVQDCGVKVIKIPAAWNVWREVKRKRIDALHFHWLHPWCVDTPPIKFLLLFPLFAVQTFLLRLRGTPIIWTVHNLKDHGKRSVIRDHLMGFLMSRVSTRMICHSHTASKRTAAYFKIPDSKIAVIPHGNYIGYYDNFQSQEQARKALGIKPHAKVILAFGEIRPYKNTHSLIDAFRKSAPEDAVLLVAGRCKEPSYLAKLEDEAGNDPRIILNTNFIPDEEVQTYLNASDLFALPYEDTLTSGAAILALSYGKACIAPNTESFREALGTEANLLYESESTHGLTESLSKAFLDWPSLSPKGEMNLQTAQRLDWKKIGRETNRLYSTSRDQAATDQIYNSEKRSQNEGMPQNDRN